MVSAKSAKGRWSSSDRRRDTHMTILHVQNSRKGRNGILAPPPPSPYASFPESTRLPRGEHQPTTPWSCSVETGCRGEDSGSYRRGRRSDTLECTAFSTRPSCPRGGWSRRNRCDTAAPTQHSHGRQGCQGVRYTGSISQTAQGSESVATCGSRGELAARTISNAFMPPPADDVIHPLTFALP